MDERAVVSCFLRHEGAVLLVCLGESAEHYPGVWSSVTGRTAGDPAGAARRTIREAVGLEAGRDAALVRRGEPFSVADGERGVRWVVHPFLFDCETRSIEPAGEGTYEWCAPTAMLARETVPALWMAYDRVRPTVETVATDRDHGAAYISVCALEHLRDEAAVTSRDDPGEWDHLAGTARELLEARPAMSVVQNRINRVMHAASRDRTATAVEHAAAVAIAAAVTADRRAADRAAAHLQGDRIATLSRSGTAIQALRRADPDAVLVAESRPGREGVDVAEALAETADVTLTSDAGFAHALAEWGADALLVGADAVLADGRVVNKAGTRGAGMVCSYEGIRFVVTAAADKLSPDPHLDLEARPRTELYERSEPLTVRNFTFDVTPAACVDAVVTERGVLDVEAAGAVAAEHRRLAAWKEG